MDLPPWTLFRPLESIPTIFGNQLFRAEDNLYHQVGVFLGYVLHHTRGRPVKVNQVVNLLLWQVREGGTKE